MTTTRRTGKSPRRKGKAGEKELAELCAKYGFAITRTQDNGDPGDIFGLPGFIVEAKRQNRWSISEWIDQARGYARRLECAWVVGVRRDRDEWLAILRFEDYLELLRDARKE